MKKCVLDGCVHGAVGVHNHRVSVILAHGSVFDDPIDTPFNAIWNELYF